MLELAGVSKRYGPTTALHPLDMTFHRGTTSALIGPSGCGKSTVLRLLIGLLRPQTGTVRFEGAPLGSDLRSIRHRMGYVIQDGGLFPHLSALRNITLVAETLGWTRARQSDRVKILADLTRFPADALQRYPRELSGGQQQRVGLMRALMLDPDVLLLDEPLAALDPLVRAELQLDLGDIITSLGKTTVMVTHDLGEAALLGDDIILMRDGRIVQRGPLSQLIASPADPFVTQFVQAQRQGARALAEADS
jgi:osmoprotectant transport system ATP-binding protein